MDFFEFALASLFVLKGRIFQLGEFLPDSTEIGKVRFDTIGFGLGQEEGKVEIVNVPTLGSEVSSGSGGVRVGFGRRGKKC